LIGWCFYWSDQQDELSAGEQKELQLKRALQLKNPAGYQSRRAEQAEEAGHQICGLA